MSAPPWEQRLRERGYRLTDQRRAVLAAVERLGHATPEQVHHAVQEAPTSVDLSTVYRTLELLDEVGLIQHAHIEDRTPTYHAIDDTDPHFHLVCHRCRAVTSVAPEVVAGLRERLLADHGFAVDVGHLTVFGECAACRESTGAAGALDPT